MILNYSSEEEVFQANRRSIIFGFSMFLLGLSVFPISQFHVVHTKSTAKGPAVFQKTVLVPFKGDAMHGAYEYLQWREFSIKAVLANGTHYVMVFESDNEVVSFNVHSINVKDSNGDSIFIDQDFHFKTTIGGIYTFSISGYYRYSVYFSGGRIRFPTVDDTVEIAIFELEETTEDAYPYRFLLPTAPILWIIGIMLPILWYSKNRKVLA